MCVCSACVCAAHVCMHILYVCCACVCVCVVHGCGCVDRHTLTGWEEGGGRQGMDWGWSYITSSSNEYSIVNRDKECNLIAKVT